MNLKLVKDSYAICVKEGSANFVDGYLSFINSWGNLRELAIEYQSQDMRNDDLNNKKIIFNIKKGKKQG